jgi:hypothetical protein
MPYTRHATWIAGNVPLPADLENWEQAHATAIGTIDWAGLRVPFLTVTNAVIWQAYPKAGAFTFGSSPVTSAGFVRTMTGQPWGADAINGFSQDNRGAQASTSSGTANTLLTDTRYIWPAMAACSVTKVEANVRMALYGTTAAGQFDKIELQVAVINAAGTETAHATVGLNSTTEANNSSNISSPKVFERLVSSDLSGSPLSVPVGSRLSVRVKTYGRASSNTITIQAPADGNELGASVPTPTPPLPIAVYYA